MNGTILKWVGIPGIILLCIGAVLSQQIVNTPELERQLSGKKRYDEITRIVDSFYTRARLELTPSDSEMLRTINRQLKMWERWKMYNGARLNEDGTIANSQKFVQVAMQEIKQHPQVVQNGSTGNWRSMGPTNYNISGGYNAGLGRVNCVAFHPDNPNIVYAGTANGGLWRRETNGNWTPLTDHLTSVSVSGVVVNYNNANDIFILTGDGDSNGKNGMFSAGVFESHDGGATWNKSGQFAELVDSFYNGYKLVQHPTNPAIFFACTTKGLYRSANYCASWQRVGPLSVLWPGTTNYVLPAYTDLEFKPGNPDVIYTCTNDIGPKFQRSTNGGLTFTPIANASLDAAQRLAIGVSANQPDWVYVLTGPSRGVGMFNGIFGSVNSGLNWLTNSTTPNILGYDMAGQDNEHQTMYDLSIAVHPGNANHIITGGIDCYNSTNGGTTLTKRTHWNTKQLTVQVPNYIHADIHNLTYNGNRLYACTDGGLSYSDNHGDTWTNIWNGLNILQPYKIAGIETDPNHWLCGTQDNGAMYRNNSGMVVQHVGGADGRSGLIDPGNISNIFFSSNEAIFFSANSGVTSTEFTPPGILEGNGWPTLTHNINNFLEVVAGYRTGIFKYYPSLVLWSKRGVAGNDALTSCPSNANRFFAAQGNKLYRSDDGADSWTDISGKPGFPTGDFKITDLSVSNTNSSLVYMTLGGYSANRKIFFSSNGGETWSNISNNLPNVATMSVAAGTSGTVYIGNELGVYFRAENSTVWTPFYNGLPKCPVYDLLINFTTGKIRAATFGRGIWESDLYSACSNTLNITGEIRGSNYFEAGSSLTASQQAGGGVGTQLVYKSNGNIIMTSGMEVKDAGTETRFRAYIGPCGQGVQLLGQMDATATKDYRLEELDNVKNKPAYDNAYCRINGESFEFYVPDYQKITIYSKDKEGNETPLIGPQLFAKGLFRIANAGSDAPQFYYKYGGKEVSRQ